MGYHTNHALNLLLRFLKDGLLKFIVSPSIWVTTKWVPTRLVPFNSQEGHWHCPPSSDFSPMSTRKWDPPFPRLVDALAAPASWCYSSDPFLQLALASKFWFKDSKSRESFKLLSSLQNTANCCALSITWSYLLKKGKNKTNFQHSITF